MRGTEVRGTEGDLRGTETVQEHPKSTLSCSGGHTTEHILTCSHSHIAPRRRLRSGGHYLGEPGFKRYRKNFPI